MKPAKRNLIICLALCAATVGIGFVQAGYFRAQYNLKFEPSEERYLEMEVITMADYYAYGDEYGKDDYYDYTFAESAEELASRSDCVLRIRVRPELEIMGEHILASADIVKTLAGSVSESGSIFIYEPIRMLESPAVLTDFPNLKGPLGLNGAANRLRPGSEYIVALKQIDILKGAFKREHEGRTYMYTDMLCSAFPCGKEPVYYKYANEKQDDDKYLLYKDLYEADYVGSGAVLTSCRWLYEQMTEHFGSENFD